MMDCQNIGLTLIFLVIAMYIIHFFTYKKEKYTEHMDNILTNDLWSSFTDKPPFINKVDTTISLDDIIFADEPGCPDNKEWYTNNYTKQGKYYNTVEKIHNMGKDSSLAPSKNIEPDPTNASIKDIFDNLTKRPCYSKKCLKQPIIDNYSGKGHYYSEHGTIKDNQWEYEGECAMNGGQFDKNLYALDPLEDTHLAI